ncbi:MAG: MATE family efflux transporter [Ruminococcaceae bacterium]|nr:MATE family efflux transporter [Oscillospiraceae bacterium]
MTENIQKNESIAITLIKFCTPLILTGILQQLYNWVDAFIVGNVVGEKALAAIGSVSSINNFYIMAITGFTTGLAILIAQKFGSGETKDVSRILSTFIIILGVAFTIVAVVAFFAAGPLLQLMDTPSDIYGWAKAYLQIITIGVPFLTIYNLYAATLRAIGDSRAPFYGVLVSSAANVVMDIIFVAVLGWGVKGAAFATIIAQIAMTVFLVIYGVKTHEIVRFKLDKTVFHRDIVGKSFYFGTPPMLQSCVNSFGNMVLQGFMNGFGTATVAAVTTAYRVDCIALLPVINLGSGISTLVAQSYGAGDNKKAKKVFTTGVVIMLPVALALTFVVVLFGGKMIALFGAGPKVVEIGTNFFRSIAVFYVIYGIAMACRGYIEGLGEVMYSSIIGITALVTRIICSYALKDIFGNMVIAYAEGISWALLMTLFVTRIAVRTKNDKIKNI